MATSEEAHRLNQRVNSASGNLGIPVQRLRNRIVFQRILARLSGSPAWVLKGGFSLEVRLGLVARATRDLDLWRLGPPLGAGFDVQDVLEEALERDLADGFTFRVAKPSLMRFQDAEPSTWRAGVRAFYCGSPFAAVTVDIVTTDLTADDETEFLPIEAALIGDSFTMRAVNLARHGAEKYHACVRLYANARPSTRVKDLVDLVLLIEGDWLDLPALGAALRRVFRERNGAEPPQALPDHPPADWGPVFARLAAETGATIHDVGAAWALASLTYQRALAQKDPE